MHSIPFVVELMVKPLRAPCTIAPLCDPLGEFVGSGAFARRGLPYRGMRPARRGHPHKAFKTHLPSEPPSKLAWRMLWQGAKRAIQRVRNFRARSAPPFHLAHAGAPTRT